MPTRLSKRRILRLIQSKLTKRLNLLKLLFAALPTIVFGVFTVVFTLQQDASSKATREQDQRQADETNRRIIFKEYINDMKELLLRDDFHGNFSKFLLHMRVQTLTVLPQLDSARKHDVIRFLYENHLIRRDRSPTIELHGADLTGMQFIKSSADLCDLPYLYLPGVCAENIIFDGCVLTNAVFDRALMSGTRFQSCNLINISFLQANLTEARFHDNHISQTNFTGVALTRSVIKGGISEGVNFTNTDLYQSDIDDRQFDPIAHDALFPNVFLNTRYPNGSFGNISTGNLIVQGEAECHLTTSSIWHDPLSNRPVELVNKSELFVSEGMSVSKTDCVFRIEPHKLASQIVSLEMFSLLIDLKQAMFSFSTLLGITTVHEDNQMEVFVHFGQDGGSFDSRKSVRRSIKSPMPNQTYSISHLIPPKTKFLIVTFECDDLHNKKRFCFFDQVKLFIRHRRSELQL